MNTKAEPGKCFRARSWRLYREGGGGLSRTVFEYYAAPLYRLNLTALQAASVLLLHKKVGAPLGAMRADRSRPEARS